MRRLIRNASDLKAAKRHRETFVDREATRAARVRWHWPKRMDLVGTCDAVMYASDKWKDIGNFEDYKHVSEADQYVLCRPGFVRDYHNPRKKLELPASPFELPEQMPEAFAELADIFGVQICTLDEQHLQVDIARAKLGGASNGDLGTFLFVYTAEGVHMIITGEELRIEKDGITG